jgi:hypothetical protein
LKPAGKVYVDLVKNQWWTNESVRTDVRGVGSVRGFLGDYEITVTGGGKAVTKAVKLEPQGLRVKFFLE